MSSIEVVVRGSLIGETIRLRPLLAKAASHSQVSSRLAKRLGLTEFRDIFVRLDSNSQCQKWKISIFPVKVWCIRMTERRALSIYPLVNGSENESIHEMVLGRDCFQQLTNIAEHTARTNQWNGPTRGPDFHSRRKCVLSLEIVPVVRLPRLNVFFEYDCSDSESVFRLAINKVTRQLAVIYRSSSTVYLYAGVSKRHEIEIERGESKGEIMSQVKQDCHCKKAGAFPVAVLAQPQLGVKV